MTKEQQYREICIELIDALTQGHYDAVKKFYDLENDVSVEPEKPKKDEPKDPIEDLPF